MNLPRLLKNTSPKGRRDKKSELPETDMKRLKRLDLLALVISAVLVLVLAGIVWSQFEGLLFKGIIVLFLMVLLCPECIAMIATFMGALLEFIGAINGKSGDRTSVNKSFAVVVVLAVSIIVLCVIAIWRPPPKPVSSKSPSSKNEWGSSDTGKRLEAATTELGRTIKEHGLPYQSNTKTIKLEVVLPPVVAFFEEDLEKHGVDKTALICEIESHPEVANQVVSGIWSLFSKEQSEGNRRGLFHWRNKTDEPSKNELQNELDKNVVESE